MKTIIFCIAVGFMLLSSHAIAGQPSTPLECNPLKIMGALSNEDLDAALTLTQHCIESEKAELEILKKKYDGQPSNFIDVIGLAESNTGAFLIAKVEILALKGALPEAESTLMDADKFDRRYPKSGLRWSSSGAPLPRARAFVLEKKGDLNGAAAAYKAILVDAKEKGFPNASMVINGRLAVIALLKGDDASAEQWSKNALSFDPGANVVWGTLLKKKGDVKGANAYLAAALKLMDDATKAGNWTLPIYFAEHRRAKESIGTLQDEMSYLLSIDKRIPPSPTVRAFGDNKFWITVEDMTYVIGRTNEKIVVPKGFVTDFASVPEKLWSLGLSPHGQYSRAAVVHDYLYWSQGCTRAQADRLLVIAMKESSVSGFNEFLVYQGVNIGGTGPWNANATERKAGLPRIVPKKYLRPADPNINWPKYREMLFKQGVKDPPFEQSPSYCVYGDTTEVP